jgi:site-specific DNA recombinase
MAEAFAYLRVSGATQTHGDGFPRQLAAINAYAVSNGITIAHVFEERGVSGTKDPAEDLTARPAWNEILTAIASNGARTIIIEKLDRLARDLMVQETMIAHLKRRGITLVSVEEPDACGDNPTRTFIRQVLGAVAELDRKMIVAKLRAARQRKNAPGGRYGYGHDPRRPNEAATLATMRALAAEGLPVLTIAKRLNALCLLARDGGQWQSRVVGRILGR